MFGTVLVANRGEIAVRVIRTMRALGIRSVAVFSDADADAPHVAAADIAVRLGPAPAAQSYLSIGRVIAAARETGAGAIHPGYGFLSENTAFAAACEQAGIVFVGPPASAIEAMGDKIRAKQTVAKAGVPVVPGSDGIGLDDAELAAVAEQIGFPVLLKPSAGGGGKGMRAVHRAADLADAIAGARREARGAFGDDTLLVERLISAPRHIEVQILADTHGNVVHLGERECSLQRRHQKIVEEAPSPLLTPRQRERLGAAACEAARAAGYTGAGTVEFIVASDRPDEPYFLEMNTRLQVEHPVTELVYDIDLVAAQLRIAAGERTPWQAPHTPQTAHTPQAPQPAQTAQASQAAQASQIAQIAQGQQTPEAPATRLEPRGHAVEARVYAEDPAAGFLPTGGDVLVWRPPELPGVRVDAGIAEGGTVGSDYDPLLAKIIAHGADRAEALRRLDAALAGTVLLGLKSNIGFLRALLADPDVRAGRLDTGLVTRRLDALTAPSGPPGDATTDKITPGDGAAGDVLGNARPGGAAFGGATSGGATSTNATTSSGVASGNVASSGVATSGVNPGGGAASGGVTGRGIPSSSALIGAIPVGVVATGSTTPADVAAGNDTSPGFAPAPVASAVVSPGTTPGVVSPGGIAATSPPAEAPPDILGVVTGATLLELEPAGPVVDPFDIPGGWRLGEAAWTTRTLVVDGHPPVEVRTRGRAADAEIRIADGTAIRTSTRAVGDHDVSHTQDGVSRRYVLARGSDGVWWIGRDGRSWAVREREALEADDDSLGEGAGGPVLSPMPGTVTLVEVAEGEQVSAGQRLVVVEAMKMEHVLTAPVDGVVRELRARPGGTVAKDAVLLTVDSHPADARDADAHPAAALEPPDADAHPANRPGADGSPDVSRTDAPPKVSRADAGRGQASETDAHPSGTRPDGPATSAHTMSSPPTDTALDEES